MLTKFGAKNNSFSESTRKDFCEVLPDESMKQVSQ